MERSGHKCVHVAAPGVSKGNEGWNEVKDLNIGVEILPLCFAKCQNDERRKNEKAKIALGLFS